MLRVRKTFFTRTAVVALVLVATSAARGAADDDPDVDKDQFREQVLLCEEALGKLLTCCPDFKGALPECNFRHSRSGGCGDWKVDDEDPALSIDESRCIIDTSCDEIHAKNVCKRAESARPYLTKARHVDGSTVDAGSRAHPPVCP